MSITGKLDACFTHWSEFITNNVKVLCKQSLKSANPPQYLCDRLGGLDPQFGNQWYTVRYTITLSGYTKVSGSSNNAGKWDTFMSESDLLYECPRRSRIFYSRCRKLTIQINKLFIDMLGKQYTVTWSLWEKQETGSVFQFNPGQRMHDILALCLSSLSLSLSLSSPPYSTHSRAFSTLTLHLT